MERSGHPHTRVDYSTFYNQIAWKNQICFEICRRVIAHFKSMSASAINSTSLAWKGRLLNRADSKCTPLPRPIKTKKNTKRFDCSNRRVILIMADHPLHYLSVCISCFILILTVHLHFDAYQLK